MTWRAGAFNAAMQRLLAYASPVDGQNCQKASEDICPTAILTRPKPSRDVTQLIQRRALVQCNRNRDQAARYLRTHLMLAKGRCYDQA
jgi:hypothetical protein